MHSSNNNAWKSEACHYINTKNPKLEHWKNRGKQPTGKIIQELSYDTSSMVDILNLTWLNYNPQLDDSIKRKYSI